MATPAVTSLTPATVFFRGVEVDLTRCTERTRQLIETGLARGNVTPNPLANLEALEERTTAQAVAQLAVQLLADQTHTNDVEDALCELRMHMDEHFHQRKLVRLYDC